VALRPHGEGRHSLVEDVVAEDQTEGVRTRSLLRLEEFDGGTVVPVAHVEPCHEEARVCEGVLRHLPPSVQEAVQGPPVRGAGIEDQRRISSGKSFQSPANSRSDRLPRASRRTTSLKLSPSFLSRASAAYASSDRVTVFTGMSVLM